MSAFVVEDSTINKVIEVLRMRDMDGITRFYNINLESKENRQEFGQRLFDMNCEAVNQRYGENQAQEFRKLDYSYQLEAHTTPLSGLKALRCLMYQCTEGEVPETELYQTMDRISGDIAMRIINRMPEYDSLPWR